MGNTSAGDMGYRCPTDMGDIFRIELGMRGRRRFGHGLPNENNSLMSSFGVSLFRCIGVRVTYQA